MAKIPQDVKNVPRIIGILILSFGTITNFNLPEIEVVSVTIITCTALVGVIARDIFSSRKSGAAISKADLEIAKTVIDESGIFGDER